MYVVEVETAWGVLDEFSSTSPSDALAHMVSMLREGKGAGAIRLRNTRSNEILFRDQLGGVSGLPQNVQVKSSAESQFETVASGKRWAFGAGFGGRGA